jgi:hypothetical protein
MCENGAAVSNKEYEKINFQHYLGFYDSFKAFSAIELRHSNSTYIIRKKLQLKH